MKYRYDGREKSLPDKGWYDHEGVDLEIFGPDKHYWLELGLLCLHRRDHGLWWKYVRKEDDRKN